MIKFKNNKKKLHKKLFHTNTIINNTKFDNSYPKFSIVKIRNLLLHKISQIMSLL